MENKYEYYYICRPLLKSSWVTRLNKKTKELECYSDEEDEEDILNIGLDEDEYWDKNYGNEQDLKNMKTWKNCGEKDYTVIKCKTMEEALKRVEDYRIKVCRGEI